MDVLPRLEKEGLRIKLVTGAGVCGAPQEVSAIHCIDYMKRICKSPSIIHWFCQNYDLPKAHDDISPIPIGIDYHTLSNSANRPDFDELIKRIRWGPAMTPIEQEMELLSIANSSPSFDERMNKSYSFFQFNINLETVERHGTQDRIKAINVVRTNPSTNIAAPKKILRKPTWENCTKYKFIVSPHGYGLDCHRTYEAMFLGSMPIVKTSSLDLMYQHMPICIVDNWDELKGMNKLLQKAEVARARANPDTLKLAYWIDLIENWQ